MSWPNPIWDEIIGSGMKIIDLLAPQCILPNLEATNKKGVLEELAKALTPEADGISLQTVIDVLMDRERLGSTGIGDNIAIPHGKLPQLSRLMLCFGRSLKGVDFDSMDNKPSHLFFMLLAPVNSAGLHLKALAKISRMLMSQPFRDNLMQAEGAEEIYRLIAERDAEF
jgi:PTS system nitrogen regulatory IIA component